MHKPMANFSKTPSGTASGEPPHDHRQVAQTIVDLHIARRTLLIYPSNHDQVKRAVIKAFKQLSAVLDRQAVLVLSVMDGGLGVDSRPLERKNRVFKELAHDFKRYGIAVVSLRSGIEINELGRFLQLMTVDSAKITAKGGIESVAQEARLPHIDIQAVDYSRLELTEEREIRRSSGPGPTDSIWHQFVMHILADHSESRQSSSGASNPGPARLAALLNERQLDVHATAEQYGKMLAQTIGDGVGELPFSEAVVQFQHLIKELNPELQEQFLAATFDGCGQSASVSEAANLVDGLGGDLIVRMLRQANSDGKEISPSLMAFINKMGPTQVAGRSSGGHSGDAKLSAAHMDSLLSREEYEDYVDEGYVRLLHTLTRQGRTGGDRASDFEEEVKRTLTDAGVNTHIGRTFERLMILSADHEGYRDWARQLTYLLDDLLESGAFACLAELMGFIRKEQAGSDPERAKISGLVMDRFNDPHFVAAAIDTVKRSMQEVAPEALVFLMELGEPVVVEIFDGLDPDHTFYDQGVQSQILENLASLTAKEALARLKDSRPEYVRRMVRIIRRLGDSQSAEAIRSLLTHESPDVRIEALSTLLKFNNKWGVMRLRELLEAPWCSEVSRAFGLAGKYKVRQAVPRMVEFAQSRGELERRAAALRALGEIGDSQAIPVLAKLVRRRWGVFSRQSDHLKEVAFETLGGYPYEKVKDLLHFGMQQDNERIRFICETTLRKMTRSVRPPKQQQG